MTPGAPDRTAAVPPGRGLGSAKGSEHLRTPVLAPAWKHLAGFRGAEGAGGVALGESAAGPSMQDVAAGRRSSNCCLGVPIDFYWHDCTDPDGHLDAAEDALFASVSETPSRRWNPHTEAM